MSAGVAVGLAVGVFVDLWNAVDMTVECRGGPWAMRGDPPMRQIMYIYDIYIYIPSFEDSRLSALTLYLLESLGIRHAVVGALSALRANDP